MAICLFIHLTVICCVLGTTHDETVSLPRWTKPWSRSQTLNTIGTSCASKPRGRVTTTSRQWRLARLRRKGKRCMKKHQRKLSMSWIQTQNCVPHSPRLKTGAVPKGFSWGRCTVGGMTAEGAWGSTVQASGSICRPRTVIFAGCWSGPHWSVQAGVPQWVWKRIKLKPLKNNTYANNRNCPLAFNDVFKPVAVSELGSHIIITHLVMQLPDQGTVYSSIILVSLA